MEKIWLLIVIVAAFALLAWVALLMFPGKSMAEAVWPRLFSWILLSALLFAGLYFVSPQQAAVAYYKFALVIAAAIAGYWIDRALFPYARPDGYLADFWQKGSDEPVGQVDFVVVRDYKRVFAAAMLRRAIIVGATILGVTLGL
ncbi:putative holin [Cellvibrio sp. PSBB023]|uniref:putative holin n=1 Tax=Cellvibrio sp. PSBB023 TaxID=1945512 RepID=UPI001AEFD6B6|nr:putative holin [Cellvibrio sp. PSBB023]